jgi:hypothetical protein
MTVNGPKVYCPYCGFYLYECHCDSDEHLYEVEEPKLSPQYENRRARNKSDWFHLTWVLYLIGCITGYAIYYSLDPGEWQKNKELRAEISSLKKENKKVIYLKKQVKFLVDQLK